MTKDEFLKNAINPACEISLLKTLSEIKKDPNLWIVRCYLHIPDRDTGYCSFCQGKGFFVYLKKPSIFSENDEKKFIAAKVEKSDEIYARLKAAESLEEALKIVKENGGEILLKEVQNGN